MAVIDTVPGVNVSIWIDGKPVKEYEDASEEADEPLAAKTAVRYIESISDTEFAIHVSVLPTFEGHRQTNDDILVKAKVDGKWRTGRFMPFWNSDTRPWNTLLEGISGVDASGHGTVSLFKFAAINIG